MANAGKAHAAGPTMAERMAEWAHAFAAQPIPAATLERARIILLDSIACAVYAADDDKALGSIRTVAALSGGGGPCRIIGTAHKAALPLAAFANGVLIRTLDLNDTYVGPRQVGHPSDNIGAALSAAEMAGRSGEDLLRAIRLGYEIYGRILDMGDPESPWDHVTVSGLATAAMVGWLLRLPADKLAQALALAATHSATLGEVRLGHVSHAKSIANSVVVQNAALMTLLAAEGITGPAHALEGDRGYAKLIVDGADFGTFFQLGQDKDRLISVGIKQYPCFALAQGPISAAIELRGKLGAPAGIARLDVRLADTGPARLRLRDDLGRMPVSQEAADHSIYFLVAVAVLDGTMTLEQLRSGRWQDGDVRGLIERMEARIDPALKPATALPCRLEATLTDGRQVVVERSVTPGNPAMPLSFAEVADKFRRCCAAALDKARQDRVIELVGRLEKVSSVDTLIDQLVPS